MYSQNFSFFNRVNTNNGVDVGSKMSMMSTEVSMQTQLGPVHLLAPDTTLYCPAAVGLAG